MSGLKGNESSLLVPHSEDSSIKVPAHLKDVPREKLGRLIWNSLTQGTARRDPKYKKSYNNKKEMKALKRARVKARKEGRL